MRGKGCSILVHSSNSSPVLSVEPSSITNHSKSMQSCLHMESYNLGNRCARLYVGVTIVIIPSIWFQLASSDAQLKTPFRVLLPCGDSVLAKTYPPEAVSDLHTRQLRHFQ